MGLGAEGAYCRAKPDGAKKVGPGLDRPTWADCDWQMEQNDGKTAEEAVHFRLLAEAGPVAACLLWFAI